KGGWFQSEAFTQGGKPYPDGKYDVRITSMFNGAWQSPEVLALVGEDGAKLPPSALKPNDAEFPNEAGGFMQETRHVSFASSTGSRPGASEDGEQAAIDAVKNAKLYVQGSGMSADAVEGVVALFDKSPGCKSLGWSAERASDKTWIVTLDYL